uniref:Uncharacterized protein yhhZ n=1 Tax=Anthurium amnicola TaxID=1678845 RepID=A0A1D1YJM3_9ARAE
MIVERKTFLIWRVAQFWIFLNILFLEIIQLLGYDRYYWEPPANNQKRIWLFEGISFAIIGYILITFNQQWKSGPFKIDIILDWVLFIVWNIQCFLNITPAIFGKGLNCNLGPTNPYNIITNDGQTRCRLFIGNTAFSFLALLTTIVTLILSKSRWNNRELILSSSSRIRRLQSSYIVQKGSLYNGEPALFFYSKSKTTNSFHGTKLRDSLRENTVSSSPINISIPEPEIAAIAKNNNSKEIPIIINDEKNENEDNFVLKY